MLWCRGWFSLTWEEEHQPRGSVSSCALCFLLAQEEVQRKFLYFFPFQFALDKSFPALKKSDKVMAMPIPHLPVLGKIEAPDLLCISSLEPRFEQFRYGKGVADFLEQLFLLTTTATLCITASEKIFLIIYPTYEYVPFKILPGEILSTKGNR